MWELYPFSWLDWVLPAYYIMVWTVNIPRSHVFALVLTPKWSICLTFKYDYLCLPLIYASQEVEPKQFKPFIFFIVLINSTMFNFIYWIFIDFEKFLKNIQNTSSYEYDFFHCCGPLIPNMELSIFPYLWKASKCLVLYHKNLDWFWETREKTNISKTVWYTQLLI